MSSDHNLEDIDSKFHLFPLQLLVTSDPSLAHFLCNFQNLILLQLTKLISVENRIANCDETKKNEYILKITREMSWRWV
jgi:hypothetical protein